MFIEALIYKQRKQKNFAVLAIICLGRLVDTGMSEIETHCGGSTPIALKRVGDFA
jgi:hypothetical protein